MYLFLWNVSGKAVHQKRLKTGVEVSYFFHCGFFFEPRRAEVLLGVKTLALPKLSAFLCFSLLILVLIVKLPLWFGPFVQDFLCLLDMLLTSLQHSLSPISIFLNFARNIVIHLLFSHHRAFGVLGSVTFWQNPNCFTEFLAT